MVLLSKQCEKCVLRHLKKSFPSQTVLLFSYLEQSAISRKAQWSRMDDLGVLIVSKIMQWRKMWKLESLSGLYHFLFLYIYVTKDSLAFYWQSLLFNSQHERTSQICTLCTSIFHSCTFRYRSRSFRDLNIFRCVDDVSLSRQIFIFFFFLFLQTAYTNSIPEALEQFSNDCRK